MLCSTRAATITYTGLLKSQLLRFHRICSHKRDFLAATKTLFKALATRGCSRSFRRAALKNFLQIWLILVSMALPFITTYSLPAVKLVKVIRNNFNHIVSNLDTLKDHRIIAAFRKNKNLLGYLVKAKDKPLVTPKSRGHRKFYKQKTWLRSK